MTSSMLWSRIRLEQTLADSRKVACVFTLASPAGAVLARHNLESLDAVAHGGFLAICLAILLGAQVVAGALAHLAANLAPIGEPELFVFLGTLTSGAFGRITQ